MNRYYPEGAGAGMADNRFFMRSPAALEQAREEGRLLEARAVLCDGVHNLWVDLGCMRGMIPREEGALGIREGTLRDIALISRVGKLVCFIVTGFSSDEQGPYAILSRRAAQQRALNEQVSLLRPGDVISARVTHLEAFGAFVDIACGLVSLLPIDAISVSRISHPRDRFRPGMDIRAAVRKVDADGRITLTHKELLGTWEENAQAFEPGQTVPGIIRSVEEYGIFVELSPNLAGLAEPWDGAVVGQTASVFIKSFIPERMKVKLIIIDVFSQPHPPHSPEYYITADHIDCWHYSPPSCNRTIETDFNSSIY